MTNSTQYINKIDALKASYESEKTQNELIIGALDMAHELLTVGYTTDQARIDADIQKDKDERSAQIQSLTDQVASLTAELETKTQTVADLTAQVATLTEEKEALIKNHTEETDTLTKEKEDLTGEISSLNETITTLQAQITDLQKPAETTPEEVIVE